MEKTLVYERTGKFGKPEFLIPLKSLPLIQKRESEKAYCCGEYTGYTYKDGNPKIYIFGWIPKSQLVNVSGELFVPTWITDKWNYTHIDFTRRIMRDKWRNEEFDIRPFPIESKTITIEQPGKLPVTMSNIPSDDPENDWEDEWPDANGDIHDDIYWSNRFAEEERKQEMAAEIAKYNYKCSVETL